MKKYGSPKRLVALVYEGSVLEQLPHPDQTISGVWSANWSVVCMFDHPR